MIFVLGSCKEQSSNPLETSLSGNDPTSISVNSIYTKDLSVPINFTQFISCAAGGLGEDVKFHGMLHIHYRYTLNKNGIYSMESQFDPRDIGGIGLSTGSKYEGSSVTQSPQITGKVNKEYSSVDNFSLNTKGQDDDFTMQETLNYTINVKGKMTVNFDKLTGGCN